MVTKTDICIVIRDTIYLINECTYNRSSAINIVQRNTYVNMQFSYYTSLIYNYADKNYKIYILIDFIIGRVD